MRIRFLLVYSLLILSTRCIFAADAAWISLFDGTSLQGWKASEHPATFKVEGGAIIAHGPRAHLFYTGKGAEAGFKNFEFEAEVNAAAGANSGIYFHTAYQDTGWPKAGFEVQVNNSATQHGDYLELKKTGSLYGLRNVYKQLVPDNTWFRMRIAVRDRNVQIRVNEHLVVDYTEPAPAPRRQIARGTFALQGHDPDSRVLFRNLRVRPLPDDLKTEPAPAWGGFEKQVAALGGANFPLVDFHTHLKGGLTLAEVLADSRQTGFGHGIAVNCGLNFGITNDAGIDAFLAEMRGAPVFLGMQAEGREWVNLFSPAAIARFDYVFTDSMTIFSPTGKRMRLWIENEVEVGDKQAFMENLVKTIEQILATEPIDIYVNPTFLPKVIADDYDALWTPECQARVVAALAKNGVALEINSRYQLPKPALIKAAKAAGVKFTLGTNNPDREIVRNDYGLAMIRECGLKWQDMWMPRPAGEKRVQKRTR